MSLCSSNRTASQHWTEIQSLRRRARLRLPLTRRTASARRVESAPRNEGTYNSKLPVLLLNTQKVFSTSTFEFKKNSIQYEYSKRRYSKVFSMSTKYFINTRTKQIKKFNKNLHLIRGNLFRLNLYCLSYFKFCLFKFILFNLKLQYMYIKYYY